MLLNFSRRCVTNQLHGAGSLLRNQELLRLWNSYFVEPGDSLPRLQAPALSRVLKDINPGLISPTFRDTVLYYPPIYDHNSFQRIRQTVEYFGTSPPPQIEAGGIPLVGSPRLLIRCSPKSALYVWRQSHASTTRECAMLWRRNLRVYCYQNVRRWWSRG